MSKVLQGKENQKRKFDEHAQINKPCDLKGLLEFLIPIYKENSNAVLQRTVQTLLYICQVPEQLGGVPTTSYLCVKVGQEILGRIMEFAGLGWSTLDELLKIFQPHVRSIARQILRDQCVPLLNARNELSRTIRSKNLQATYVYNHTQNPNFLLYRSLRDHLIESGYEAVHLTFEKFTRCVTTRFVEFPFSKLVKGSIRILPSSCAFSSKDVADIPQLNMSQVTVLWSMGMNMPVIVVNLGGKEGSAGVIRFCSRITADGKPVTPEMYDHCVYRPNVHQVINSTQRQLPDANLVVDSSKSTSAHGSDAAKHAKLNTELMDTLTVPIGRVVNRNDAMLVFSTHNTQWNDEMAVNDGKGGEFTTCSYKKAGFGRHSGDIGNVPGALGSHDQILPLDMNHDSCTGSYRQAIIDQKGKFYAYIVDSTTPEYAKYEELVGRTKDRKLLDDARNAVLQLSSTELILKFTTEPFANCGMFTIITISCRTYSDTQSVVYVWGSPSRTSFNVGTERDYRDWVTHNLDSATTKGYPEYPKRLVDFGSVRCNISADELFELYNTLLIETANFLDSPNEDTDKRVKEIRCILNGVIPLCENPVRTKKELYNKNGLNWSDVAEFENTDVPVDQMLAVAALTSSLKAKLSSYAKLDGEAIGVTIETAQLSSSKRYKPRRPPPKEIVQ